MKKFLANKKNVCFMAALITILELAVMISTPYSRSVLPVYPLNNLIWQIVVFTMFFFVFSGFVIFCFTKLTFSLYKKEIATSFFKLLLIRIILDLGCYIFQSIEVRALYSLITDCIFSVIMFQVITFAYLGKNMLKDLFSKLKVKEKPVAIVVLLYALVVIISITSLSYMLIDLKSCAEKYVEFSYFYLYRSMSCISNSQLLRMFSAIVLQTLLIIMFNKLYKENTDKDLYVSQKLTKLFARITIAVVATFLLICVKSVFLSVGTIANISIQSSTSGSAPGYSKFQSETSKTETADSIGSDSACKRIYRVDYGKTKILINEETKFKIKCGDNVIRSFTSNNFDDYKYVNAEQNNISGSVTGAAVRIGEQTVEFFSNQYITFILNKKTYVIGFKDICKEDENNLLTAFIEYMLSCGYFDYFEYGCEYLLKYDPEFIKPYITRYAKGDFTEEELAVNEDIRTEYMVSVAKEYMSEFKI